MEYVNLGKKEQMYAEPCVSSTKRKQQIYYPSFRCEKELPISGKEVGKNVMANVELRVKSVEKVEKDGRETSYEYRFDVVKIKFPGKDISSTAGIKDVLSKI